jgi:RecB family endonuclease NucS
VNQIRPEQSFSLYANCTVDYDGRARSTLEKGNYLIVHKSDGTLLIHGGTLCTPRNYQPPGAILKLDKNKIISFRKGELIVITVFKILSYNEFKDWSKQRIDITKTEKELRDKIASDINNFLKTKVKELHIEFPTPVGNIDILAIDEDDIYHVIEVKRGKANLAACSQLDRYSTYFINIMKNVKDYIASPDVSSNAIEHMGTLRQTWIKAVHSI